MIYGMDRQTPWMPKEGEPIPPQLKLQCLNCGYQLTGLTVHRCPECGEDFDPRNVWLEQEKATWEFHFQNIRPKKVYALYMFMLMLTAAYGVILCIEPLAWMALFLVFIGELVILQQYVKPAHMRLTYLIACLLWAIFVLMRNL